MRKAVSISPSSLKTLAALTLASCGLITVVTSQTISCPILTCDQQMELDQCYQHDNMMPVETIRTFNCDDYSINSTLSNPLCELNLQKNMYAWYSESTQQIDKSVFQHESALNQKKVTGMCREAASIDVALNNGRSCSSHAQCYSKYCLNGACKGLDVGEYCNKHADCDNGFYCKQENTWPFASKCNKANTNFEQCTDTYQCGPSAYCWYVSEEDRRKDVQKCLPLYSQEKGTTMGWKSTNPLTNLTAEDFRINGMYCKSGLAFPLS